jgi:hypothetical protein
VNAQAPTRKGGKTLRTPAYLEDTDIDLFVPVYAACAARGINALAVDEMEVWQVASALEVDMDDDAPAGTTAGPPPPGALSRGRGRRQQAVST